MGVNALAGWMVTRTNAHARYQVVSGQFHPVSKMAAVYGVNTPLTYFLWILRLEYVNQITRQIREW